MAVNMDIVYSELSLISGNEYTILRFKSSFLMDDNKYDMYKGTFSQFSKSGIYALYNFNDGFYFDPSTNDWVSVKSSENPNGFLQFTERCYRIIE